MMHQVGVVTIGRNESKRQIRCLTSQQALLPTAMFSVVCY